jgi:hypothetical protein
MRNPIIILLVDILKIYFYTGAKKDRLPNQTHQYDVMQTWPPITIIRPMS